MPTKEYIQGLLDERATAVAQSREILERSKGKTHSEEDETAYQRASDDIDRLGHEADDWLDSAKRERELDVAREAVEEIVRPEVNQTRGEEQTSNMERFLRGQTTEKSLEVDLKPAVKMQRMIRSGMDAQEVRAQIASDAGDSGGSLVVPVEFVSQMYQFIEASSAIRQISRVITTNSGEPMTFPKVATHGVGTRVSAQGVVVGGTDPIFGTMRLEAYKYGELVKVSSEMAADAGFDILGFVAENIGRAVGRITDTAYVTGDGTGDPNGIVPAADVGSVSGGSLIALGGGAATTATGDVDDLIDLQHTVVAEYRDRGTFVMHDSTAGTLRKLRDGGRGTIGAYVWTPSTTIDSLSGMRTPDRLLGAPVFTDGNFGTNGSNVTAVAFGDFSAYYIRDSGGFRFERSDERYFDEDNIGFRGILRTDADLIDTNAIKTYVQRVSV